MRSIVAAFGRALWFLEGAAMKLSAGLLLCLLLLINVEVFGRYLLNYSTLISDEYGGYFYSWIVLLGGIHLLRSDQYLTMTALVSRLPPGGQNAAAVVAALVGLAVSLVPLHSSLSMVGMSYAFGTTSMQPSATPLFYPQLAMPIGYGLLSLAYVEEIVRRGFGLPPRRASDDAATYGVGEIG